MSLEIRLPWREPKPMLNIRLLGPMVIVLGDKEIYGLPKRARALLAYLATEAGHQVFRERLVDLLWPESSASEGRPRLRTCLLALRNALSPDPSLLIAAKGDALQLVTETSSSTSPNSSAWPLRRTCTICSGPRHCTEATF